MADVMLWKLLKISVPTEPSSGKYVVQVVHVVPLPHFFTCAGQVGQNFFWTGAHTWTTTNLHTAHFIRIRIRNDKLILLLCISNKCLVKNDHFKNIRNDFTCAGPIFLDRDAHLDKVKFAHSLLHTRIRNDVIIIITRPE